MLRIRSDFIPPSKRCSSPFLHVMVDDGCFGRCKYCGKLSEQLEIEINAIDLRKNVIERRKLAQLNKKLNNIKSKVRKMNLNQFLRK